MNKPRPSTHQRARFVLGSIFATPGALEALRNAGTTPAEFLSRHQSGDWGDVCDEDAAENELALGRHLRLFSVYHLNSDVKIWVITEADRSGTTILLPDEY